MAKKELFGLFVCTLAVAQLALYAVALSPDFTDIAFYLDPRIGIFFVHVSLFDGRAGFPAVSSWISAFALLGVGWQVFHRRVGARWYMIVESLLALPSVVMFVWVILADMSPAHGFSVAELVVPVGVFCLFTAVPVVWAATLLRRAPARVV